MNTKISYLYRDASNYKNLNEVIVKGTFTKDEEEMIYSTLNEGLYFIPRQIGLPETRFEGELTEDDHCWFELEEGAFEPTDLPQTELITAEDIVKAFEEVDGHWDDVTYAIIA